jgi:hypothetical protein
MTDMRQLSSLLYAELSTAAQAAFSNLEGGAIEREIRRSVADISGSFVKKVIKGTLYWYYQTKDPDGKPQQVYLGADSPFIQNLLAKRAMPASQGDAHLARLSKGALALGCAHITPKHGRVIKRVAERGFFAVGGVLAGTHAFLAYQNMLGITWRVADMTMDFAHPGNNLTIAMPDQLKVDMHSHSALESLNMGFIPVYGQARFKKEDEPDFDIDFLTVITRNGTDLVNVKSLGVSLQPLKFMELAFEHTVQTALLLNDGPLVVNLPQPQYFALHKLIVSVERRTQNPSKSAKDLIQSGALIHYFLENNPSVMVDAYEDVIARGPGWKSRITQGMAAFDKKMPDHHLPERLMLAISTKQSEDADADAENSQRPDGA